MDLEEKKMADKSQREKDKKSKQKVSKDKKKKESPNYLKGSKFDGKVKG
jgi:hypothetical protein